MSILDEIENAMPNIQVGKTYRCNFYHLSHTVKAHVRYVLPSIYKNQPPLIVFAHYGKYKQWWHEEMLNQTDFKAAILNYKKDGKR